MTFGGKGGSMVRCMVEIAMKIKQALRAKVRPAMDGPALWKWPAQRPRPADWHLVERGFQQHRDQRVPVTLPKLRFMEGPGPDEV